MLLLQPSLLESTDELDMSLFHGKERKTFAAISEMWEVGRPDIIDLGALAPKLEMEHAELWLSNLLDAGRLGSTKEEAFRSMVGQLVKKKLTKEIISKINEQSKMGEFDVDEIKPLLVQYESAGDREKKLAYEVRNWVMTEARGEFNLNHVYSVLGVVSVNAKASVRQVLARMVQERVIDYCGKGYGQYRKIGNLADPIDIMSVTANPLSLYLPLGLGELVNIYPKNIIVIAGESSKGKTALALDFVKNNMENHEVRYFFKEGGPQELRSRLEPHSDVPITDWKMLAFEHDGYVADAVAPNCLNVYDYLHIGDQAYYEIDKIFNDVQNKLREGIALICIQKNRNKLLGDGGDFSLRVPRLYITLTSDLSVVSPNADLQYVVAKIEKAKSWKQKLNPEGRIMPFTIREGWQIEQRCGSWEYPESHQAVKKVKLW